MLPLLGVASISAKQKKKGREKRKREREKCAQETLSLSFFFSLPTRMREQQRENGVRDLDNANLFPRYETKVGVRRLFFTAGEKTRIWEKGKETKEMLL